MTPDERQMISGLFDRIRGASNGPKDRDAEAFIEDAMRNTPSAAYVLAQTVLVQQQAMEAAARRISELEAQAKEPEPPQQETSFLGNIGRSLFGGAASAPQPPARAYDARSYERDPGPPQRPGYAPPPPAYAPPPQQGGPWGAPPPAQGGGFLHGALQTAAGVAGGVLLGNALGGLFGGHSGGGLFGGGGGFGGASAFAQPTETINNYYGSDPAGQHAEDVLQDQDQDQDAAQDADDYAADDTSGGGGDDWT